MATGHGFKGPVDAIPMPDGSILVAEMASGSILRVSGPELKQREVVAQGLNGPVQMTLGRDGHLYVTEAAGSVTRVNLADRSKAAVANGLALPKGIAQTPWGSFVVLEAGAKRLTEIDLATGARRTVASNLPVGMPLDPGTPPVGMPTGVTVDAHGNIYFSADLNNAVYKVRPQR